jgi:hypothetical protein
MEQELGAALTDRNNKKDGASEFTKRLMEEFRTLGYAVSQTDLAPDSAIECRRYPFNLFVYIEV